jgi:hypothetical protein
MRLESFPDSTWPASIASGYSWIVRNDSLMAILGTADETNPNFVQRTYGNGMFFLHTFPYMFSNYHMLYKDNHQYVSRVLAEIPVSDLWIWDTYYLSGSGGRAQTPLIALNRYRSFRWGYWLAIIGIGIFLLFTARRRQRMIPVLKAKRNTTLDFVQTIGDLYFHRADHGDLISKKIAILQGSIQRQYRLSVTEFSDNEAGEVAIRSGQDVSEVGSLFRLIRGVRDNPDPRVQTLFALQQQIDRFLVRK